jgi:hypothetical protein
VPPSPCGTEIHDAEGEALADGEGPAAGARLGDAGAGGGVVCVGAAWRSSTADSGVVRLGAAAWRTDRMPSHDAPIVAVVAKVQTSA